MIDHMPNEDFIKRYGQTAGFHENDMVMLIHMQVMG